MRDGFGFAKLRSPKSLKTSANLSNSWKQIQNQQRLSRLHFSALQGTLSNFTPSSHWLSTISPLLCLVAVITLVLDF